MLRDAPKMSSATSSPGHLSIPLQALTPVLIALTGLLAACDILYPPPTLPPETTLSSGDEELHKWLFAEDLSCHERMDWASDLWPCSSHETPLGEVMRCALDAPLEAFEFGCGRAEEPLIPDPSIQYPERLRVSASSPAGGARLRKVFNDLFGECEVVGRGPAANEAPRYPGDPGVRICKPEPIDRTDATIASGLRKYPGGEVEYPMGVFLELPPLSVESEGEGPEADAKPNEAERRTVLAVETELLGPEARDAAVALFPDVLEALATPGE